MVPIISLALLTFDTFSCVHVHEKVSDFEKGGNVQWMALFISQQSSLSLPM